MLLQHFDDPDVEAALPRNLKGTIGLSGDQYGGTLIDTFKNREIVIRHIKTSTCNSIQLPLPVLRPKPLVFPEARLTDKGLSQIAANSMIHTDPIPESVPDLHFPW